MTTETYLDLTYERATKSGKRPIRPKLLKLTDVTIPHRNRKKTKVKTKDRSQSSVRDRIYDDPAYTDDISHLANPLRRSSCSGSKADAQAAAAAAATTPTRGSSSLGKRSKLTKEFLQYTTKCNKGPTNTAANAAGSYELDASSSSNENLAPPDASKSSLGKRGRSLERNSAVTEKPESKKREKRERTTKQRRNLSLDNSLQNQLKVREPTPSRSKERSKSSGLHKQYSDGPNEHWTDSSKATPDEAEMTPEMAESFVGVSSGSKDTQSTKMQIGRRILKGEIGIKSFNYYLLKEGLKKSSKKFVEKQRNTLVGGSGGGGGGGGGGQAVGNAKKRALARSEENIYEEIFFKDAPPDEPTAKQTAKNEQPYSRQKQHQLAPTTPPPPPPSSSSSSLLAAAQQLPTSSGTDATPQCDSEDALYTDCLICMQECTRENCQDCLMEQLEGSAAGRRPANARQQQAQTATHKQLHFGSLGRVAYINHANSMPQHGIAGSGNKTRGDNNNGNVLIASVAGGGNNNLPAAHILEFQSYNPNNPGVYKIETTPVAITGEYNPILQFQQSAAAATGAAVSTLHEQQQAQQAAHLQHQKHFQHKPPPPHAHGYALPVGAGNHQQQQQQQHYASNNLNGAVHSLQHSRRSGFNRLASTGGQQFMLGFHGGGSGGGGGGGNMQRISTKSSSSSDSLHQQHLHKYNTMSRLEANMLLGDPFYGGATGDAVGSFMHPLMYAASRPIGGSQILVDSYEPPKMYKSDSKASILSEYSLRSSDNSQRYGRHRVGAHGGGFHARGEISDSSLGDSMFSSYASAQRRYFGSSESCRFVFECRRCSLDGASGGEKCSFSDNCRYECRNCDCSSSYFSSDFDDMYGSIAGGPSLGSGIPRKTAAGTLPSSNAPQTEYARQQQQQEEQLELKQNKYAQDFFKHVNDVKRSIYQSELQRSSGAEASSLRKSTDMNQKVHSSSSSTRNTGSPKRSTRSALATNADVAATLPLTKERLRSQSAVRSVVEKHQQPCGESSGLVQPTPAPRTSLQNTTLPPRPMQRRAQILERREYPSLDRLVAAATGAIPKAMTTADSNVTAVNHNSSKQSPRHNSKSMYISDQPLGIVSEAGSVPPPQSKSLKNSAAADVPKRERLQPTNDNNNSSSGSKKHHARVSSKTAANAPAAASRRKDTPAPPPPSPATYTDLQELKVNMSLAKKEAACAATRKECNKVETMAVTTIKAAASVDAANTQQNDGLHKDAEHFKQKDAGAAVAGNEVARKSDNMRRQQQQQQVETQQRPIMNKNKSKEADMKTATKTTAIIEPTTTTMAATEKTVRAAGGKPVAAASFTSASVCQVLPSNAPRHKQSIDDEDDDDVFYDARSEDSAGTATSVANSRSAVAVAGDAAAQRAARRSRRKDEQQQDEGRKSKQFQQQAPQQVPEENKNNNRSSNNKQMYEAEGQNIKVDNKSKDDRQQETEVETKREIGQEQQQDNNEQEKQQQQLELTSTKAEHVFASRADKNQNTTKSTTTTTTMTLNLKPNAVQVEKKATTPVVAATAESNNKQLTGPLQQQQQINSSERATTTIKSMERIQRTKQAKPTTTTTEADAKQSATTASNVAATAVSATTCCQPMEEGQNEQQQKRAEIKANKTKATITAAAAVTTPTTISATTTTTTTTTATTTATTTTATTTTTPTTTTTMLTIKSKEKVIKTKTETHKAKKEQDTEVTSTAAATTTTTTTTIDSSNTSTSSRRRSRSSSSHSTTPTPTQTCALNNMLTMLSIHKNEVTQQETTKEIPAQIKQPNNSNMLQQQHIQQVNDTLATGQSQAAADVAATSTTKAELMTKTSLQAVAAATIEPATTSTMLTTSTKTTPTTTATTTTMNALDQTATHSQTEAVARRSSSIEVSRSSDIAGVVVVANNVNDLSNSESQLLPTLTTRTASLITTTDSHTKRPPLNRQDYSCLDSSEAYSDDSRLTRDSCRGDSQNDELSSSTQDKIDVTNLPLPALPPKKRRSRSRANQPKQQQQQLVSQLEANATSTTATLNAGPGELKHLTAFQQYAAKRRESLEASTRSFNEKLEARRMHYHSGASGGAAGANMGGHTGLHKPTYLFGEKYYAGGVGGGGGALPALPRKPGRALTNEEIFLNKSGWVQVNTKRVNDENTPDSYNNRRSHFGRYEQPNGREGQRNTIRVIQIDNTRRREAPGGRQTSALQHQHSFAAPSAYAIPKISASKIEELISRNEARRSNSTTQRGVVSSSGGGAYLLRPGYKIVDPQIATLLNERPGFLPVRNFNDADSPPPVTPILSPPPAFQDSKSKYSERHLHRPAPNERLPPKPFPVSSNNSLHAGSGNGPKGMVFSRSFEYDNRKTTPTDAYVETFSRSFDGNLSEKMPPTVLQRDRSPNFSTLTGSSPNYLTKKDSGGGSSGSLRSRDSSPKYQQPHSTAYLNTSVKEAPPSYSVASSKYASRGGDKSGDKLFERSKSSNGLGRSRKAQFSRVSSTGPAVGGSQQQQQQQQQQQLTHNVGMSRFRSFDTTLSQRLNSCDSGARSDLSNDELDNEDDDGSTEFLTANYHRNVSSPFKNQRQRSLTPERNDSHSSSSSLRKQRSLTPESRSLTPEDRRKKGSQNSSLMGSRQNSSSRSNTLERKQKYDDKTVNISRSSSSSSYSGRGEHEPTLPTHVVGSGGVGTAGVGNVAQHRRAMARAAKQVDEHRIRRSRSLQLSERSPNRSHKMVVSVGQTHASVNQAQPIYQQAGANMRTTNNIGHSNFPPTIRTTGNAQPILVNSSNNGAAIRMRNMDIDKSRSFDFDYGNYNNGVSGSVSNSNISNGSSGSNNQNVPLRLDFDKSRSFDDVDYREQSNNNNSLLPGGNTGSGMRYLHANDGGGGGVVVGATRFRRTSPGPGAVASGNGGGGTHSPQSSGSSCNNLNLPRQSTSPQNYGTRLCDHDLTYDMLRKSLDRSPIMDFRRNDSGDYEVPTPQIMKNRETINAGGNSELNFLNNEARIYDHPTTIKQRGGLGQSPSESQYSLERLHNSRDSVTPDSACEYKTMLGSDERLKADYLYRQQQQQQQQQQSQQQRGSNRGSKQTTTTTKTTCTTTTTTPTITTPKTPTTLNRTKSATCTFWPHCGACPTQTFDNITLKRQGSVKRRATQATSKCHTHDDAASVGNRVIIPLRRDISQYARNEPSRSDAYLENAAFVSVKVNVNACDSSLGQHNTKKWLPVHEDESDGHTPSSSIKTDSTLTAAVFTVNNAACVLPLPAASSSSSLLFLGDCEMPITRERDYLDACKDKLRSRVRGSTSAANGVYDKNKRSLKQSALRQTSTTRLNYKSNNYSRMSVNNTRPKARTTTNSDITVNDGVFQQHHQQQQHRRQLLQKQHSISLPDIFQLTEFSSKTATTTTINDGISVIGIRTGYNGDYHQPAIFSSNLAHQLRAVSSPSLTETTQDAAAFASNAATTTPTTASGAATTTATATMLMPGGASEYVESQAINTYSSGSAATIQNVGVLQKFKRTFSNFNKSQQQPAPPTLSTAPPSNTVLHIPAASIPSNNVTQLTAATNAPITPASITLSVTSAPVELNGSGINAEPAQTKDQSASKYRFGPLIWRSSKERRKTKYNRRDKCNSGDSGIQIELENDEQFARVIGGSQGAGSGGLGGGGLGTNGTQAEPFSHKSRIRRANSAKATTNSSNLSGSNGINACFSSSGTTTTCSSTAALSAKAKILKKMDAYDCRVAPASIPARSLSQPSGLDRLAAPHSRTNADLDESDTDSVSSSHPDCNEVHHHRPLYAEVLYNFTPAGPQELSLERGALVEILRKEIGPWWYGRKKSDAVVETLFEPQLGWFPKDFVRIIQFPESDGCYSAALQQQQRLARAKLASPSMDEKLIAGSTAASAEVLTIGNSSSNNVTTIIIEPASETNTPVKRSTSGYCQSDPEEDETNSFPKSNSGLNVLHDNPDILHNSAVKELYDTEVNYVKLLAAICRGYLPAMSKRIDIFTPESIRLIFSNIESIFKFQQQFLEALRCGIERNRVAQVFLEHQSGFLVYSTYCNSYPRALIELESYSRNKDAKTILENCRLAENLPELPLSAHLLAPIQRICRYPLHLAELIKNSFNKNRSDADIAQAPPLEFMDETDGSLHVAPETKESLESALKAMKNVTEAVNEGKRHSENLARHQSNFENFSGPPLHFHSTRYFMQIDATRVSPNLWNNTYTLFLFDHQLIYCKKDILKRQHFIYKGRIFLDSCRILNLPDGKIFGATVKNALRIYCDTRNKWFDFSFRSANRKRRFLTTLALERQFCGKNLFISELAGDETTDERDLSDREYHSDYETPVAKTGGGDGMLRGGEGTYSSLNLHCKENMYDVAAVNGSGSSSMPESPAKLQHKYCDTLPKKSQRQATASTTTATTISTAMTTNGSKEANYDYSTSSLGRRKLGNWFRKSKSTNSTPNQSPTHQPMVLGAMMQLHSDSSSLSSPALGGGGKIKEMSSSASS